MIWNRLPKTVFVEADVLNFGAYDAVAHFNIGNKAAENIISELGLTPGHFFTESLRKGDTLRVKKAGHRNTPEVKKRRKILRGQKRRRQTRVKKKRDMFLWIVFMGIQHIIHTIYQQIYCKGHLSCS